MSGELLIGIDIGTSSCKTVIFDRCGAVLAQAREPYDLIRRGDEVEQDPQDYIRAATSGVKRVLEMVPGAADRVVGIGLTGQVPTDIFLDKDGMPLMPGISWQDTRARLQAQKIAEEYPPERMLAEVGSNVSVSSSWSASRLLWVYENRRETARKTRKILMPKDYVGFAFTGKYLSDGWSCKSTVNLSSGKPCGELLNFLGFGADVMPAVEKWSAIRGGLTSEAAHRLGLKQGTPVSNGCSDAPAAMLGSGIFHSPGIAFDSAGTSEIVGVSAPCDAFAEGLMTIPSSVTGSLAVIYGPTQCGSSSLVWLNRNITGQTDCEAAFSKAAEAPWGSGGLMFIPYLAGERSPICDADIRGSFVNLGIEHDSRFMTRAVLEGVGFSVRHCLSIACSAAGIKCRSLRVTGGGSGSDLWLKIKSGICGVPVEIPRCRNACALGAAMTVAVGAGLYSSLAEASENMVLIEDSVEAPAEAKELYDKMFEQYLQEVGFSRVRTKFSK